MTQAQESPSWRTMTPADLPAVMGVAAVVHPAFPEDEAVFAERLRLAPEGCHALAGQDGLLGYCVSHPWPLDAVPALNAQLGDVPMRPANWYIHDLALLPAARGGGAAGHIVAAIAGAAVGAGCTSMALVAVSGSAGFWHRQGFRERTVPALAAKLASYDDAARYMVRDLTDGGSNA